MLLVTLRIAISFAILLLTLIVGLGNESPVVAGTGCPGDLDCDGVADATDNCPDIDNPSQANTDNRWSNGPTIAGDDGTVPNSDLLGDACDPDLDNDGLLDADELAGTMCPSASGDGTTLAESGRNAYGAIDTLTSPPPTSPSWDTDGDIVPDGIECIVGTDPKTFDLAHRTVCAQYYAPGEPGGIVVADADGDGLSAAAERCKWNSDPDNPDTSEDPGILANVGDCAEAYDISGNGIVNAADRALVNRAAYLIDVGDLAAEDVNANGLVNVADGTIILRASNSLDPCL